MRALVSAQISSVVFCTSTLVDRVWKTGGISGVVSGGGGSGVVVGGGVVVVVSGSVVVVDSSNEVVLELKYEVKSHGELVSMNRVVMLVSEKLV